MPVKCSHYRAAMMTEDARNHLKQLLAWAVMDNFREIPLTNCQILFLLCIIMSLVVCQVV